MPIGFCSSPRFVLHETGDHPEQPDRIKAVYSALDRAALLPEGVANPFPEFALDFGELPTDGPRTVAVEPYPADLKWVRTVHTQRYIDHVRSVCESGGGSLDEDTLVVPESFPIALLSAGAALAACDAVVDRGVTRAFVASRPPGHHALPERAMGFCVFCNVAIAARYLQEHHRLDKIAIVDFDVHHGNGTQAVFEDDPSVLYVSLHEDPRSCYPGTGHDWDTGHGPGRGATLNVALPGGAGDEAFVGAVEQRVLPALGRFHPEMLLISAGFDAHADDPLAHLRVTDRGYADATRLLVRAADYSCHGQVVSLLEGGYNLRALGRSVVAHVRALGGL